MPKIEVRFLRFSKEQDGAVPPVIGSRVLGCSVRWLRALSEKGEIAYIDVGGVRYYGYRSLRDYYCYRRSPVNSVRRFKGEC